MNRVDIDRVVIEGVSLSERGAERLRLAIRAEVERRLSSPEPVSCTSDVAVSFATPSSRERAAIVIAERVVTALPAAIRGTRSRSG